MKAAHAQHPNSMDVGLLDTPPANRDQGDTTPDPEWIEARIWQQDDPPGAVWVHVQAEQQPENASWVKAAEPPAKGALGIRLVSSAKQAVNTAKVKTKPQAEIIELSALPYLMTIQEVAALFRTTVGAIYARVERGQMPGVVKNKSRKLQFHRDHIKKELDREAAGHGRKP